MVTRAIFSVFRAALVALLLASPVLLLPNVQADTAQTTLIIALIAGFLTFLEYFSNFPTVVDFRYAPPVNRMRFVGLAAIVLSLTLMIRGLNDPTVLTRLLISIGQPVGHLLDFPYSPVRLVLLLLPPDAAPSVVERVRIAAGLSYTISITTLCIFLALVRFGGWPKRWGDFNFWINLPLFDPTSGGDIVERLRRDAQVNIILGVLLPFLIPAAVKAASDLIDPITLTSPNSLIWTVSAWAFLPASMIMRGVAISRVGSLLAEKRRASLATTARNT